MTWCPQQAHPRAGGENHLGAVIDRALGGSSPRGRGKPQINLFTHNHERLIPARAGKTIWLSIVFFSVRAHPRAGGENWPSGAAIYQTNGSSPRGRGKRTVTRWAGGFIGLIPARAGKTLAAVLSWSVWAAHPRAGGENVNLLGCDVYHCGSSPRGRGKRINIMRAVTLVGLIPARAGKTHIEMTSSSQPTAHPRAGGENALIAASVRFAVGSSPRGRGKLS